MIDDYSNGYCDVLAVGESDVTSDDITMKALCDRGIVLTDSLIVETVSLIYALIFLHLPFISLPFA